MSFYAYVGNDAVNLIDPSGLQQHVPPPEEPNPKLPTVPTGKAKCQFAGEVHYEGNPCKNCMYHCRGYGLTVFSQAVEKDCPSIDPTSGLVNTDEIDPKCGGRKPCDKRPDPVPVPQTKPLGAPLWPIIIDILEGILEGAAAAA